MRQKQHENAVEQNPRTIKGHGKDNHGTGTEGLYRRTQDVQTWWWQTGMEATEMREMWVKEKWRRSDDELIFTNYRFPRRDNDWRIEELVRIVYKPTTKDRFVMGIARIIRIQDNDLNKRWSYGWGMPTNPPNTPDMITYEEAHDDGFHGMHGGGDTDGMISYYRKKYGWSRCEREKLNKITLYWIDKSMTDTIAIADAAKL